MNELQSELELEKHDLLRKLASEALITLEKELYPSDIYILGSQGRIITTKSLEKNTRQLVLEEVSELLKIRADSTIEIDITVPLSSVQWEKLISICQRLYEESGQKILIDPHLSLIKNNFLYTYPVIGRKSYKISLDGSVTIQTANNLGKIKSFSINAHAALLKLPQLAFSGQREKYEQQYHALVQAYPQLAEMPIAHTDQAVYELLRRQQNNKKPFPRLIYHAFVPPEIRGRLANLRKKLTYLDSGEQSRVTRRQVFDTSRPELI